MKLSVSSLETLPFAEWNDLVEHSGYGTIFSRAEFYRHHDVHLPLVFFQIHSKGKLIAGCAGIVKEGVLYSPQGASYGGLIFKNGVSFRAQCEAWACFLNGCAALNISRLHLTFPPSCYDQRGGQEVLFWVKYLGFLETKTLFSSVLDLKSGFPVYDEDLRNQISQARRFGLKVDSVSGLDAFYAMLVENKKKYNQSPVHSPAEIIRLLALFPDSVKITGVFQPSGKLIAAALVMACKSDVLLFFYIASNEEGRKQRAVPFLVDHVIREAEEQKIRLVDFGVSHETASKNPMDPRFSLIHFKENFGAAGWLRPTFSVEISLALTRLASAAQFVTGNA